jgi:hypothetical protein
MSLINIGELAAPATKLIEKVSDATGALFEPHRIIRKAKAEARGEVEAAKIRTRGEIEVENARLEALDRADREWKYHKEEKERERTENILGKTWLMLEGYDVDPDAINVDWLLLLFDKARLVSDDQMQTLWARVLAGEAKEPGSFSKRCLDFLSTLEKDEANLFTSFCGFVIHDAGGPFPWVRPELLPYPLDTQNQIAGEMLAHLDSIGLITYPTNTIYINNVRWYDHPRVQIRYFEEERTFRIESPDPKKGMYALPYGPVSFTAIGRQLFRIAGAQSIPGFFDFLESAWTKEGVQRETTR